MRNEARRTEFRYMRNEVRRTEFRYESGKDE